MVIYMYSDMPESFERSHSRDHYGVVSAFHKIILMKKVKTTKFLSKAFVAGIVLWLHQRNLNYFDLSFRQNRFPIILLVLL